MLQRKFSDLEQDPCAAAHARGDSSDPSEQSETLSQTELHKMQRELSHRYLEENKNKNINIEIEIVSSAHVLRRGGRVQK